MEDETLESENISTNITVTNVIERLLKDRGASEDCKYEIQKATAKGENYIGVVYRITANLEDRSGKTIEFNCILKVPPQNAARRKQFFARPCFLREALAYEKFLPLVEKFQRSKANVCYDNCFNQYAECYCTITEDLNEAIFLEDLTKRQYKLFDRFRELDKEHVECVMRTYGKLHAISLAIKDQAADKLVEFRHIIDIFEQRKDDPQLGAYFEHLKTNALKALSNDKDKEYLEILKRYFEKDTYFNLLLASINGADSEPYTVVCHGDCWNNNFLFKYKNGVVVDVCLIDWQLMRYSSPVVDLMYYIFTCTTKEFRNEHYTRMLDVYHNELSAHLERMGSCARKLFPRSTFERELKNKGVVGLLFAMMVLPVMTLKGEDTPNLEELSARIEAGETTDLKGAGFLGSGNTNTFEERMRDVIVDIIDYGYIHA